MPNQHTFEKFLLKYFFHPFFTSDPVEFRSHLKSAKHVLILCPESYETSAHIATLKKIIKLFPKDTVQLTVPGKAKYNPDIHKLEKELGRPVIFPDAAKDNLLQVSTSEVLKNLKHQPPDVLIDIDAECNLINLFLCKLFPSAVRIGFSKSSSHSFYNMEYNQRAELSYGLNLENFFHFLKSFTC